MALRRDCLECIAGRCCKAQCAELQEEASGGAQSAWKHAPTSHESVCTQHTAQYLAPAAPVHKEELAVQRSGAQLRWTLSRCRL